MTWIAGYLDAVGYVQLGHLYVSFMSGNSTQLGMTLAAGHPVFPILAIIAAFVLGSAAGTVLADKAVRYALVAVFASEIFTFIVAIALVVLGYGSAGLALAAVAMGMQNTQHQAVAGADVGKGFVTGSLFALGESLVRCLQGRARIFQALSNLLAWGAFVTGVLMGAHTLSVIGLSMSLALIVGVLILATCAVCLGRL